MTTEIPCVNINKCTEHFLLETNEIQSFSNVKLKLNESLMITESHETKHFKTSPSIRKGNVHLPYHHSK